MRETLTHFDRRIFWRSEGGGYTRIPDQAKSTQNHNYITSIASKDHPAARARHALKNDNIAHYHAESVPAPAEDVLTPTFQLQYPDRQGPNIA